MSDTFTQADAEALGWRFVHEQPTTTVDLGDGISRRTPASYVAEKNYNSGLQTQQGETPALLLERIRSWEQDRPVPAETSPELDPATQNDTIYDGEKTSFVQAGEEVEPEQGAWKEHDEVVGVDRTPPREPEPEVTEEDTVLPAEDESAAQKIEGAVHDFFEGAPPAEGGTASA
jgi:hypothetical protein